MTKKSTFYENTYGVITSKM